jgi:hypothetical protein
MAVIDADHPKPNATTHRAHGASQVKFLLDIRRIKKPLLKHKILAITSVASKLYAMLSGLIRHGQLTYRTWNQSIWDQVVNDEIGTNCK